MFFKSFKIFPKFKAVIKYRVVAIKGGITNFGVALKN